MQWEKLRADQFEEAVVETGGVCIVPVAVLEYHGSHLPLGTDVIIARHVADEVAKIEPAIVFPVVNLSSNFETKAFPGGIVVDNQLLFALFENICDEIGRNGCKKIMFISGHGGNKWFLPQFIMSMLDKGKDWVPYYCDARGVNPDSVGGYMNKELFNEIFDSEEYGHACEWEASEMLHIDPDLVDMGQAKKVDEQPREDLSHLKHMYTPMDWIAMQPELTRGTPGLSTAEKGRVFLEDQIKTLAELVALVKKDTRAREIYEDFNRRLYRG
ncbi:MAG: creatininase family protein [Lentisphaeria bacterium]|nr:creatininase family protein [Lentisphaeria bacterium]